jgi:hypothetical protein
VTTREGLSLFADVSEDRTARRPRPDATLRFVAEDYVAHLRHHLQQIRGLLESG